MFRLLTFVSLVVIFSRSEVCPDQEYVELSNGVRMPRVGVGLAGMKGTETRLSLREHLKLGFRMLDGAESTEWYDDEAAGDELRKMKKIKRENLFIVSKVHPTRLSFDEAYSSVLEMLERWHTSYLDLVLLHYPECGSWIPNCQDRTGGDWVGAWKALERHYTEGVLKAIGVSNFDIGQLQQLLDFADIEPHVIQSWMDPFHQDREIYQFAVDHNIVYTAYSSFGTQWQYNWVGKNLVFESKVLQDISNEAGIPVTSVVLAWLLTKEKMTVIPRSSNKVHIQENAKFLQPTYAYSLLTEDQLRKIEDLDGVFDAKSSEECEDIVAKHLCNQYEDWCQASCRNLAW